MSNNYIAEFTAIITECMTENLKGLFLKRRADALKKNMKENLHFWMTFSFLIYYVEHVSGGFRGSATGIPPPP